MGQLLYEFLSKGFFPKELPPCFSTSTFGTVMASHQATLPVTFRDKARITYLCEHSLARSGGLRRRLGIPNPILYFALCEEIEKNWTEIKRLIDLSRLSVSKPQIVNGSSRSVVGEHRRGDLIEKRADARAASRFILKTDISEFYHSVYTHSIAWAVHNKTFAKTSEGRKDKYFGNLLDKWIRNSQDQQTLGIPVGPDTSYIIAELILSQIDVALSTRLPNLRGFRFYDDYEFSFTTRVEAEEALETLQACLQEYELRLNPRKTKIDQLPQPADLEWVTPIRSYEFRTLEGQQRTHIARYFEEVFRLFNESEPESIVPYAVSRLEGTDLEIEASNWPLLQNYLCQCMLADPSSMPYCFRQLLRMTQTNDQLKLDSNLLSRIMNLIIASHAKLGHSSEVAWAIWACLAFDLSVDRDQSALISDMEDSIVALLALEGDSRGKMNGGLNKAKWAAHMDQDGLYGE